MKYPVCRFIDTVLMVKLDIVLGVQNDFHFRRKQFFDLPEQGQVPGAGHGQRGGGLSVPGSRGRRRVEAGDGAVQGQAVAPLVARQDVVHERPGQAVPGRISKCTICLSNIALLVCPTRNEQFVNF